MSHFRREAKETPKRVIRAYEATVRAWQAQPQPLLRPDPEPAPRQDFPMREESLRDIERRAAMVRGLSVQDAARKLHAAGECGDAVLDVLGIGAEVKR